MSSRPSPISLVGFFGTLSVEEREQLIQGGRRRRYPRGSVLFTEGESSDRIVVVLSGRVKISYFTDDGREVVLAVRSPGDLLGELSVLDGEPRSATATALEPVEAVLVAAGRFRDFLGTHSHVALVLLQTLSARLRDADRKRIEFAAYDTIGRVARRLVELADRFGQTDDTGVRIAVPLSQDELAGWVGASRKAVANALAWLRDQGIIETRRLRITIRDLPALRDRAT